MTGDRQAFFADIRNHMTQSGKRRGLGLTGPRQWPVPAFAVGTPDALRMRFIEQAKANKATLERLASPDLVAAAICDYLRSCNIPLKAVAAPALSAFSLPGLNLEFRTASETDRVSVSEAMLGVAETGTLVFTSSPGTPTLLNFAPEIAVVLLKESHVVGSHEEVWNRLDQAHMPRALNFVSGPSRTGDIEQTMYLGAHGPRHLHIVLIADW